MDATAILEQGLTDLADVLQARKVEYALIGGLAVEYHGFARGTEDIDLVLEDPISIMQPLWSVALAIGLEAMTGAQPVACIDRDFDKGATLMQVDASLTLDRLRRIGVAQLHFRHLRLRQVGHRADRSL